MTKIKFTKTIQAANERKQCQVDQKKKGESLLTDNFQVRLEAADQWERWLIELQSTLKMIIGTKGIALEYVIRKIIRQTFPINPTGKKGLDLQPLMLGIHTGWIHWLYME